MKIIGKTSGGFILQAQGNEIYNLIGFVSSYIGKQAGAEIEVGDDIQVAAMFSQLYGLFYATNCIDSLKEKAQELIDELEKHPAVPVLRNVKVGWDD